MNMNMLARMGAEARIGQIQSELKALYQAFPGLRSGRRAGSVGSVQDRPSENGAGRRSRRSGRRPMTAAQKAEVSRRMKAYWAKRREGKKR